MLQVRHLVDTGESREMRIEIENVINSSTPKLARNGLYLLCASYSLTKRGLVTVLVLQRDIP